MGNTRIVTDSAADLAPEVVEALGITVVPLRLRLGSETLDDSPELRTTDFYRRAIKSKQLPSVAVPTPQQFTQVYNQLARETDDIVSIHLSSHFNRAYQVARTGAAELLGRCRISVVDSQLISHAQGILVAEAAKAARSGGEGPEIVHLVRGMIPHTYFVFYVETLEQLKRGGLVHQPREAIPAMPNVKPLLIIEDGQITPVQRLRSRGKATERLLEFAAEFSGLKQLVVLYTGLGPDIAEFKTQLAALFPRQKVEEQVYGPVFSAYVGPMALGLVAFEQ